MNEANGKFRKKEIFLKSSLANVRSHYLLSFLSNDIHFILGTEKGRMAPLFLPRNLKLLLSLFVGEGGGGLIQISERYVHVYHF